MIRREPILHTRIVAVALGRVLVVAFLLALIPFLIHWCAT